MRKFGKVFCWLEPPLVATEAETLAAVLPPPPHPAARSVTPTASTARLTTHVRRSVRVNSSTSALTAARPGLRGSVSNGFLQGRGGTRLVRGAPACAYAHEGRPAPALRGRRRPPLAPSNGGCDRRRARTRRASFARL